MDVANYYAKQAIAYDKTGHWQAAEYFYLEAARALTDLINQGKADRKLFETVEKYRKRAENIKVQEECAISSKIKSEEQTSEERIEFILSQGLSKDEEGSHREALALYTQGVQYCLDCAKKTQNNELKRRFQTLATVALERAEKLKELSTSSELPDFPDIPDDGILGLDIPRDEDPMPSSSKSSLKVRGKECLNSEELKLLAFTSKINGISFMPFLNDDIRERFAFPMPFCDHDGLLALAEKQKARLKTWYRLPDLCQEPKIIENINSGTIKQNLVSDCSFVASLAVSAQYERKFKKPLITNIIYPQNKKGIPVYNPCGKYMVKLYLNGILRKVLIDDRLPVGADGEFLCSYSQRKNEFWVQLLEKAYMKVMGGYDFPGSNSNIDLNALTGWIPERIPLHSKVDPVDKDTVFEKLFQRYHQGQCLVTLATGKMPVSEVERSGLVDSHAYAVLDLRKFENKKLLLVKNPWTHLRWKGRYSEKDTESWTPELCKALDYNPKDAQQFDDGVFWIDLESVCHFFDVFYVNWNPILFPFSYVLHSCWTAGQGPIKDLYSISENPQYKLDVNNKLGAAAVWILLTRHIVDKQDFEYNTEYITVVVYPTGKRIHLPNSPKPLIDGARINSPHYLCQLNITDPGVQRYTLVVAQYEKSTTIYYTLRLYSTTEFSCSEIKHPKIQKTIPGEWKGITAGGCGNGASRETVRNNPIFHLELDDGSDENTVVIDLRGPKQFHVGFEVVQISSRRNKPFNRCTSGDFRSGCTVLELNSVPAGTYSIMPMTFNPGQEGPFLLKIQSDTGFKFKRVQ
ncbi:unnamed protein product [Bursaphelenchus xylophilus]|uniref:(pine wood nematode) hypothetical protein n=1 Tax=Bursaphelenchus xylophilus TaxID=6326 RepID=A0A1I7ST67_BURXY|nr:unnamed protein product [Bursaphelenchus xylophilus]CAG9108689.1 unnamed protein product [Bursaphelenchus xylophilus]